VRWKYLLLCKIKQASACKKETDLFEMRNSTRDSILPTTRRANVSLQEEIRKSQRDEAIPYLAILEKIWQTLNPSESL
jgi:hypothetical protein